jgi:hypothetical protein
MKRNIADLPKVIKIGKSIRAKYFRSATSSRPPKTCKPTASTPRHPQHCLPERRPHLPRISLPKMDFDEDTRDAFSRSSTAG